MHKPYPDVDPHPSFPALERDVLDFWQRDDTFRASLERRKAADEFVFYDGPPFANGLPHHGHLLTGFVKDTVPRYQTMRGRRVERRFGWDCHGLPVEMAAEKQLQLPNRAAITEFGIGRFTDHCRRSVLRYTGEWESYVTRQARWVDFAGGYRTMDLAYTESVMWAFNQLWQRGLIYEGHRVLPYCWECETPLSAFETRLDDSYRERVDTALTVRFLLDNGLTLPAWTTTPWTLPSNLALAVAPDLDYAVLDLDGERVVLAEAAVERYALRDARRVGTAKGRELAGSRYTPLFDFFTSTPNAFRVLAADFVSAEEGTGVVHLAPGFGEDDQRLCESHGIPVVCPVDDRARFTDEMPPYEGLQVFDANEAIARDLLARGAVLRSEEQYAHPYPHCWRTDTPLIHRAVSSWFVRVSAVRERMLELNQQIDWVPAHVRDGAFAKGIASAPDWSISRNRFWGAPVPVWRSDDPDHPRLDVYGSLDDLERDFGVRPSDLHRPWIDELTRPNPDDPTGRSTMRRVPEVLDCWFESGSMPFAQVHYPFENRERFDDHFPADFVCEYVGQTRGWFYTMHVLSTALFDKPPFRTAVAHGIVLGPDGRKLGKRLGNALPDDAFEDVGADAIRWSLLSSSVLRGQDVVVDAGTFPDASRSVLSPLWNAWRFLATYANADGLPGNARTDSTHPLDRYALARTHALVATMRARLDAYDLPGACAALRDFLDALNNWYVRRSRDRFWQSDADARDTLFTVLEVVCRAAAPLLPLLTEAVWRPLTGRRSVHLADYPGACELPDAPDVVRAMETAREVCAAAHAIREAHGLRVRLPLPSLTVAGVDAETLEPYRALVADEVNVKDVLLTTSLEHVAERELRVDLAAAGPRLGAATRFVLEAVRAGDWTPLPDGRARADGHLLEPHECAVRLRPLDETTSRLVGAGVVVLDVRTTPALQAEGLARDVVRVVQQARREAGLDVSDRITLTLDGDADVLEAVETHASHVRRETLAVSLVIGTIRDGGVEASVSGGRRVQVLLRRQTKS